MASKTKFPVPALPDEEHQDYFSDYGFDPQIHYSQFLEEARKQRLQRTDSFSTNLLYSRFQKPISKDDDESFSHKLKMKKQRWWKNALLFFNRGREKQNVVGNKPKTVNGLDWALPGPNGAASMPGPVYVTESRRSGSSSTLTTSRRRPNSGPLPYVSLKGLNNVEKQQEQQRVSTSALPIYLVT